MNLLPLPINSTLNAFNDYATQGFHYLINTEEFPSTTTIALSIACTIAGWKIGDKISSCILKRRELKANLQNSASTKISSSVRGLLARRSVAREAAIDAMINPRLRNELAHAQTQVTMNTERQQQIEIALADISSSYDLINFEETERIIELLGSLTEERDTVITEIALARHRVDISQAQIAAEREAIRSLPPAPTLTAPPAFEFISEEA